MIQAICWTLIHSLWQGLLLTFLTGIVLVYTKKAAAAVRYNLLSGLFFLFLTGCALTFIREWNNPGPGNEGVNGPDGSLGNGFLSFVGILNDYLSEHASLIVMGWCFIFLFKCVRMTAAIVYTQRVRNYGVAEPPAYWKDKVQSFCQTLQIKRTVLLQESTLVKMPFVTGHWKPVIFIPLGLLTKLPEGEIEAVLFHELAHIRRNDVCMNFLQNIGESLFFFNPGLLWVSSLLREERENCCDDMAIDRTKNKAAFIRALIHFREYDLRLSGAAVAFPAGRHQLLHRVKRIVDNKNKSLNKAERIFFIASFFIIALLLAASTHPMVRPVDSRYNLVGEERTNGPLAAGSLVAKEEKDRLDLEAVGNVQQAEQSQQTEQTVQEKEQEERAQQAEQDRTQAEQDAAQAEQDRVQAEKDRLQEAEDRQEAEQAREQARRDKLQADMDRQQEQFDKLQAVKDLKQAQFDKLQAEKDRVQVSVAITRTTVTRTTVTQPRVDRTANPR
ncbi:MAG TPA: M56 family metallopeptidase [Puia sp.]|nr:M56 family metallopeptidase [Puia sp.]